MIKPWSNNQENFQTVVHLRSYGNLSGGVSAKRIITPTRCIKSTTEVGDLVGSFHQGLPASGQNNFRNTDISFNGDNRNNQTISLSNNYSNINNPNSLIFSWNNTSAISKNRNYNLNNNKNMFGAISLTTNITSNNNKSNVNWNINNKEVSNFPLY